jgi:hypothetical protein
MRMTSQKFWYQSVRMASSSAGIKMNSCTYMLAPSTEFLGIITFATSFSPGNWSETLEVAH